MTDVVAPRLRRVAFVLACALVAGCTQQDVDRTTRDVGTTGRALASAAPGIANDGLVVAQLEAAFVRIDPDSALHVAVASHGGRVRLRGRARSTATIAKYLAAAKRTSGVRGVTSSIVADASLPSATKAVADFAVVAAVRANLAAQAGVNAIHVGIDAHDGTVVLHGTVATQALRATIASTTASTAGVRRVVDRLVVAP